MLSRKELARGLAGVLVIGASLGAMGQGAQDDKALELPDVVVSAARTETLKERVGGSVTVLGREEIERSKAKTIHDLLRRVPGVVVTNQGGPGKQTNVSIRGAGSDNTLVLVDGIPINSPTLGGFDFSNLQPANIERIEILRGPQNTLYGSAASAGVINIITRKGGKGFHGKVQVEGGTLHYHRESLSLSAGTDRLNYTFSAEASQIQGVSSVWEEAGNKEEDPYKNVSMSHSLGIKLWEGATLDVNYRLSRSDNHLDGDPRFANPDDVDYTSRGTLHTGGGKLAMDLGTWGRQTFSYGRTTEENVSQDPTDSWRDSVINTDIQQSTAQTDLFLSDNNTLSLGYVYETRDGESVDDYKNTYHLHSGFLENQLAIGDALFLTLGTRYDDFDDFGSAWTGRGSFALMLNATRFHGSIATGFRAPDLNDLFWPVDPFMGGGNPDLEAERSVGGDIGVEQAFLDRKLVIDVTYFETKYRNLIDWQNTDPLNPWFWQPVNIDKARMKGVEATLVWEVMSALRLNASYTYTDTEDFTDGSRLARRPLNKYTFGAEFDISDQLSGSLTMVAIRDRVDTDDEGADDYERWDLALTYAINDHFKPYVRIENLFDANYQEVTSYTSPGIHGYAGVEITW